MRTVSLGRKLILATIAAAFALLVLGEMVIRAGIALGIPRFRRPDLYADCYADDDYWKLYHRWGGEHEPARPGNTDPLLGWAPATSEANPLGLVDRPPYQADFETPGILFFGDSFVAGATGHETSVPAQLEKLRPGSRVYNYGVGGYGVDQAYLRFAREHARFTKPLILFGILPLDDLDRCVLGVRTGQKPYFEIDSNGLVLKGTPIHSNQREWLRANPPRIRSYALAAMVRALQLRTAHGDDTNVAYRREEKKRINARILEEVVRTADRAGLRLLFVLFYSERELKTVGWRETFVKQELQRLSAPYVDTRPDMLQLAGGQVSGLFLPGNGHPTAEANKVIAGAIARRLSELGW